jgi:hypothetical protein
VKEDYAIIIILDAFFLSCTDPLKYKDSVLQAMPILGEALLDNTLHSKAVKKACNLLNGIVLLYQSEGSVNRLKQAFSELAEAFGIEKRIVRALVGLSQGRFEQMK